jgi:hypothetical protein
MSDETKLCVDCRHCVQEATYHWSWTKFIDAEIDYRCRHPDYAIFDPVTGRNDLVSCGWTRDCTHDRACGPEGRGWEINGPDL